MLIILGIIVIALIVVGGNRYYQRQQTKAIIRAIRGPKVTPINQGGWRDPLLWKFLAVLAIIIAAIVFSNYGSH